MGTASPVDRLGIRVSSGTSDITARHCEALPGLAESLTGTSGTNGPLSPSQCPSRLHLVLPASPQNPHRAPSPVPRLPKEWPGSSIVLHGHPGALHVVPCQGQDPQQLSPPALWGFTPSPQCPKEGHRQCSKVPCGDRGFRGVLLSPPALPCQSGTHQWGGGGSCARSRCSPGSESAAPRHVGTCTGIRAVPTPLLLYFQPHPHSHTTTLVPAVLVPAVPILLAPSLPYPTPSCSVICVPLLYCCPSVLCPQSPSSGTTCPQALETQSSTALPTPCPHPTLCLHSSPSDILMSLLPYSHPFNVPTPPALIPSFPHPVSPLSPLSPPF